MSRDNASQRILSPRQTTQGHDSSLRNTYGSTLVNGAQCFVIEEESNYRFLRHSELHADGKFVVEPIDQEGRWVRECGTFGIAIVKDNKPQLLVQFALDVTKLVYTGNVARLACVAASSVLPGLPMQIELDRGGELLVLPASEPMVLLKPGDRISIRHDPAVDATVTLVVALA